MKEPSPMWEVLGADTSLVRVKDTWKGRMIELSQEREGQERFLELLNIADINYWFDGVQEVHSFYLEFPDTVGSEELEFVKGFVLGILEDSECPLIRLKGDEDDQEYALVFTSEQEEDTYKGMGKTEIEGD